MSFTFSTWEIFLKFLLKDIFGGKKYSYINKIQCKYLFWVIYLSLQRNNVRKLICVGEWVMRQYNKLVL